MTSAPSVPLNRIGCARNLDALRHRFVAPSSSVLASEASTALDIRSATDADWPAISLLDATSFGVFGHPESLAAWRTLIPTDGSVLACDGDDVVGMAHYLDMRLTVPGGAGLPVAGVTIGASTRTHRPRRIPRGIDTHSHQRT